MDIQNDLLDKRPCLGGIRLFTEITADPLFQIFSLAHVYQCSVSIQHLVHATQKSG